MFGLRFDKNQIPYWANRYDIESDKKVEIEIAPKVQQRAYIMKQEFLEFCHWKSPRILPLCNQNPEDFIKAVTRTAFSSQHERLRIEVLMLLHGVGWPTASVLLHFGCQDPYPILDFRALWSLRVRQLVPYDFSFWWVYTSFCRQLAKEVGVSMRTLDRALWQFARENSSNKALAADQGGARVF